MSVNPTYLFTLNRIQVESLIKALSASDYYHKNYNSSHKTNLISDIDLQFVLDNNDTLRNILKTSLCPRPSETVHTVVEGIPFVSVPVDSDLPFCPYCELAQLDVSAPYSCQCEDF